VRHGGPDAVGAAGVGLVGPLIEGWNTLPAAVEIGWFLLVSVAVTLPFIVGVAKVIAFAFGRFVPGVQRGWQRTTPNSRAGPALVAVVLIVGTMGGGSLFTGTAVIENTASGSIADPRAAVDRNGLQRPDAQGSYTSAARPTPDTDRDRLKDSWEAANETPWGVALPGADPYHKDIYVQINYGSEADRLSAAEREQLREVWARMPVENPDGETGITLHLDDQAPRGGRLDEPIRIVGKPSDADLTEYYDDALMGSRTCTYHQALVGTVDGAESAGWGAAPGYSSITDEAYSANRGSNVTLRVGIMTHELLHNVVGEYQNGDFHTGSGWLSHGEHAEKDYLSKRTARKLSTDGFAVTGCHRPGEQRDSSGRDRDSRSLAHCRRRVPER